MSWIGDAWRKMRDKPQAERIPTSWEGYERQVAAIRASKAIPESSKGKIIHDATCEYIAASYTRPYKLTLAERRSRLANALHK